jgi:hypothetical protein
LARYNHSSGAKAQQQQTGSMAAATGLMVPSPQQQWQGDVTP